MALRSKTEPTSLPLVAPESPLSTFRGRAARQKTHPGIERCDADHICPADPAYGLRLKCGAAPPLEIRATPRRTFRAYLPNDRFTTSIGTSASLL